jgi:hypothetical protein
MIYVAQCLKDIEIKSLRLKLKQGQVFECTKNQYDSNQELKGLVSRGILALRVKDGSGTRLGVHSNRYKVVRESKVVKEVVEKPVIVEKVVEVEKIVEKEVVVEQKPQLDMNELANVLLQQLGSMISPEAIAEAVAKQIPTQQVINNPQNNPSQGNMNISSDDSLTFIPSNIISSSAKASSESLANETKSEGSEELSDALSALKALRKANKK